MANAVYDKAREAGLNAGINWTSGNIKAYLVNASYTPNLSTHQYVSDLGANIVATSGNITGKSTTAGVANGTIPAFSSVSGAACPYLIIAQDTGTTTTSPLICCIDTATGLPVTPNGGNITVTVDSGSNKLFKL